MPSNILVAWFSILEDANVKRKGKEKERIDAIKPEKCESMEGKQFQRERYWRREKNAKKRREKKKPNGGKYGKREYIGKKRKVNCEGAS